MATLNHPCIRDKSPIVVIFIHSGMLFLKATLEFYLHSSVFLLVIMADWYCYIQIECGTYVGDNKMWLVAGNSQKTQVTILEFTVPSGVNSVATFTVTAANRIICMTCVSVDNANLVSKAKKTVWIGSENSQ